MKFIWEEDDIVLGRGYIAPNGNKMMFGYGQKDNGKYCVINLNTGCVGEFEVKEQLLTLLNNFDGRLVPCEFNITPEPEF